MEKLFSYFGLLISCLVWILLPIVVLAFFSPRKISFVATEVFWGIVCGSAIPWVALLGLFLGVYEYAVKSGNAPGEGGIAGLWFVFGGLVSIWIGAILGLFKESIPTGFLDALRWALFGNLKFIGGIMVLLLIVGGVIAATIFFKKEQ